MSYRLRIWRIFGVPSLGPSSKVREMTGRFRGPRQTDGPNTCAERPRTAHARNPAEAAALAATPPGEIIAMKQYYCSGVRGCRCRQVSARGTERNGIEEHWS